MQPFCRPHLVLASPVSAAVHTPDLFKILLLAIAVWAASGTGRDGREAKISTNGDRRAGLCFVRRFRHALRRSKYLARGRGDRCRELAFVPQHFRLVMAKNSSVVHECRVAWIQKNRIGLTFMKSRMRSRSRRHRNAKPRYSIRNFASRTTLPHLSISSLIRAPNCSGVLATGLKPSTVRRSLTSGWATILAISR